MTKGIFTFHITYLGLLMLVFALFGCTSHKEKTMEKEIEVIVQHFHGCPNGPKMIDSVKKAIEGLDDRVDFSDIIIDSEKKAVENDFRGSPTLLIAGEDYEDLEIPEKPGLTCRFYPDGLPDSESIRKKILDKLQR